MFMADLNSETESQEEKPRQINTIKLPLASQQIFLLKRALPANLEIETVINTVENLIKSTEPEELYKEVTNYFNPIYNEKTKQMTGLLFMYKKKPCREGENCTKGEKCIFVHENEKRNKENENIKRRQVVKHNREVVLNRVPNECSNEILISDYVSKFGNVGEVKKLNDGKFLVRFTDLEGAKALMESDEPIMDYECISKFYNAMPVKGDELDILFMEQSELMYEMYKVCSDKKLFMKLKGICVKIKETVCNKRKENKIGSNTSDSLYFNQFK